MAADATRLEVGTTQCTQASLLIRRKGLIAFRRVIPTQCSDQEIGDIILAILKRHRRRYGYRRIWLELSGRGVICAADRVHRIMIERA